MVFFVILSSVGTSSDSTEKNLQIIVTNFGSDFIEFLNKGISAGCDTSKDIFITTTSSTNMIDNFANDITAKVNDIKAAISLKLSRMLTELCGPLNFLFGGNTIESVVDLFTTFGEDAVDVLQKLVGETDEDIHYAFCEKDNPATLWNYFMNLYTIFNNSVTAVNPLLSDSLCGV